MNQKVTTLAVMALSVLAAVSSYGQSIWTNPITDGNPSAANPFTAGQTVNADITVSGIGRGTGISANAGSARYNASSWNTVPIDIDAYFTFTLTPNAGKEIDLVSFVYTGQASGSGPTSFRFRSSVDSFVSDIGTPIAAGATIDLSGAPYQNLTSAIEFRLYGFGASGGTGTFSVNDFTFNGTVSTVGGDVTPPVISTLSPTDGATNVAVDPTLSITFDETVQKGAAGNVTIKKTSDNSIVDTIDITTAAVTVAGDTVTIDPAVTLAFNTEYYVTIDAGAFKDNATIPNNYVGLSSTTAWSFTTLVGADITPPTLTSTSPADNDTGVLRSANLVATFDETVLKGATGNVFIKKTSDNSTVDTIDITTAAVSVAGAVVTINPAVTLEFNTEYYVTVDANAFTDNAVVPNNYGGLSSTTSWSFTTAAAPPPSLVINEIYGGGGNTGAVLIRDFVELYNGTASSIDLSTYSLQYASFDGNSWGSQKLNLTGSIAAGQHYLIRLASGGPEGSALPPENIAGSINIGTVQGKIALVSNQIALTGSDPQFDPSVVDFVGYGGANAFETAAAASPSVTLSISRTGGVDSDDNLLDFSAGAPTPTAGTIVDTTAPTLVSTNPADNATSVATTTNLVATFSETIQKGASGNVYIKKTSDNTTVDTIDITTASVTVAGDTVTIVPNAPLAYITEYYVTIDANAFRDNAVVPNNYAGLSSTTDWSFSTAAVVIPGMVINEIYTAGGNASAVLLNDFVELYNGTGGSVDLSTYSLQYTSDTGSSWSGQKLNLTGTLLAGETYLIKLASGGAIGAALPTANITGIYNMSASAGKIALVSSLTALTGNDPQADPTVVDFVGYGASANAFETAVATAPSVTLSISRTGGVDSDDNSVDFTSGTPSPIAGTVVDTTPPILASTSPADNATEVSPSVNLVATYDETVQKGAAGNVTIKKTSDNSVVDTIDITTAAVTVSGAVVTIDPSIILDFNTEYYVTIDANAFKDNAAIPNDYAGLSSTTAWSFTTLVTADITPPTLVLPTSPADNVTNVATTTSLVATFSETVQKGASGNVYIKKTSDNSTVDTIDITTAAVTAAGNTVTIVPTAPLALSTEYYVTIDANAFRDNATVPNNYAGLSSTTDWSFTTAALFIPGQIVISQVYGGGGNTGATYTHDFIELHNNSAVAIDITGWSVQYASTAGTFNAFTALSGSIPAGGYYLVQGASAAAVGLPLPTPDATGTLSLSAANGKVALVGNTTLLAGGGPTGATISDFVGYGSANLYEGAAAAPVGSNTLAVVRQNLGTLDTDVNNFDFVTATPNPRNSASSPYTATANGSGIASIANLTPGSPLLNSAVFGRSLGGQTAAITLTGTFPGSTLTDVTIDVPAAITGLLVGNVSLTGAGSASVMGNTITITGAAVTTLTGLTVTISGLSTPDTSLDITNDGNYAFVVATAENAGTLTAISSSPTAYVVIPIANIRDQDANGVPLDFNDKVAVQGVCTEGDFNSNASITSAYLQDSANGVNIFSNSVESPFVRGNEYVTLGNVIQFRGLTEVSFTTPASAVFDLGPATQPTPITVTLANLLMAPESYEGKLITVIGLSRTTPGVPVWGVGVIIPVTDDGAITTLDIYVHNGSTAISEPFYPAAITGVFGQFDTTSPYDGGYELHPRDPSDIVSSGLSPYQQWAQGAPYNLVGGDADFDADPDRDCVPNGIEFIVGGNPTVANDANALVPRVSVAGAPGSRVATIEFRTTAAAAYLNPELQYSAELITWNTATVGPNVLTYLLDDTTIPGVNLYTLTVNANDPKGFFRLFGEANP